MRLSLSPQEFVDRWCKVEVVAYGWPEDLADEEILARLLAPNLARAG